MLVKQQLATQEAEFATLFARDAGTGGAGGAAAPLAFCWEGARGAKVPFKYKEYYITVSFQGAFVGNNKTRCGTVN